jgi:prolyl oligopeptidase
MSRILGRENLRKLAFAAAGLLIATASAAAVQTNADPYLWLENITGAKAMQQVKAWNAETEAELTKTPGYEEHRKRALAILNDPKQIALPDDVMGDIVANHWVDADHKRGLWRISPLQAYVSGNPQWRTLIDVDALGAKEGKSWVWHGADCLPPQYERCLVSLSPGGGDADVIREFDIPSGQFVIDGFTVPLGKNNATWVDRDTLLVAAIEGEGTATRSGYPRIVKMWKRGTPWSSAKVVSEGTVEDISVQPFAVMDGDTRYVGVDRGIGFYADKRFILAPDGRLVELPIPETAVLETLIDGQAIVSLIDRLGQFQPGSVVAFDMAAMLKGERPAPTLVMAPSKSQAIEQVSSTDNVLWIKALDDVSGKLFVLRRQPDGSWSSQPVQLPQNSTIQIVGGADKQDIAFATVEGMLDPTKLVAVGPAGVSTVQALPAEFDASKFSVEQRFYASKDGTRIPMFVVRKKGLTGPAPTILYGYGGFDISMTPAYSPTKLAWMEAGGVFAVANLRGGGEYGKAWHDAGRLQNKQNVFDDFIAAGEYLKASGITGPEQLAIEGGSNGGLLVGAVVNQRPDLFAAAHPAVGVMDMLRFDKFTAGRYWVDDYGYPNKEADFRTLWKYSPYHNIRGGTDYPAVLVTTADTDDRVVPGHSFKYIAALQAAEGVGSQPHLIRIETRAGHGSGKPTTKIIEEAADVYAFLGHFTGLGTAE